MMTLRMKHLEQRGKRGTWYVRRPIPKDVSHAFANAVFKQSLKTSDHARAVVLGKPILDKLDADIARARKQPGRPPASLPIARTVIDPLAALEAIQRWQQTAIENARIAHFNRLQPVYEPGTPGYKWFSGPENRKLSSLRYSLQMGRWGEIEGFDQKLAEALQSERIAAAIDHPALVSLRRDFARAWYAVEVRTDAFRHGDFAYFECEEVLEVALSPPDQEQSSPVGITLWALVDRFVAVKGTKSEDDLRYHWRRLIERLGDVPLASVEASQIGDFLVDLRRFPKTRQPAISALKFDEILERHPECGPPLTATTVWKHFSSYKKVFDFAVLERRVQYSPIGASMPSKPPHSKKVLPYTPEQISELFSKPMFTGCSEVRDANGRLRGYRSEKGSILLKDGRYWMPILSLFHGSRMEEWGGAKVKDIRHQNDIYYLDLMERSLKTENANRRVPIHPHVIALGFLKYVEERRQAGDHYLFPEFPHDVSDAVDPEASTRQFTKWWGLWSDANGFENPSNNFHSFRHAFIRNCRGVMDAELRSFLVGHRPKKEEASEGFKYGDGAELKTLFDAISKVDFPTFPNLLMPSRA